MFLGRNPTRNAKSLLAQSSRGLLRRGCIADSQTFTADQRKPTNSAV